jgi:ribosomal protein S18 acetylase RimI-like enzyme
MGPAHLTPAQRLSAAVGWPHRVEDWAFALHLGQGLVALEGDSVVGTIAWWPFGEHHATLGLIIVAPQLQGRGIGGHLMDAALMQLGARSVMLNATAEGLRLYAKLGFQPIGTIRQHQGTPQAAAPVTRIEGGRLRPLQRDDMAALAALDERASGLPRAALLGAIAEAGTGLVLETADGIAGYAFCRRFGRGKVIGPVVAPDQQSAQSLIAAWLARNGSAFQRVDTTAQGGLSDWLADRGLPQCDEVITMVRGTAPHTSQYTSKLFALASQALG